MLTNSTSPYKTSKFLLVIHRLKRLVFCYVLRVEQGISMVSKKTFICFCWNALYTMQLSMHNYLLQYDGFHSLHFTACGLMQVDRNNFSSLDRSNIVSDTRCPCSHDWRKYTNQHHPHMYSPSVCSLH